MQSTISVIFYMLESKRNQVYCIKNKPGVVMKVFLILCETSIVIIQYKCMVFFDIMLAVSLEQGSFLHRRLTSIVLVPLLDNTSVLHETKQNFSLSPPSSQVVPVLDWNANGLV
jgi:hypothetical protein